ncbi:MAG: type II secretion system protein [Armatimonadota bacterium]
MIRHDRAAFTLIELLVTIAIIAILTSILFPVFARARAKARQAVCASNCRQVTVAVRMYADDHDDALPGHGAAVDDPLALDQIGDALAYPLAALDTYVKSEQIWHCPGEQSIAPWGRPSDEAGTSLIYAGFGVIVYQMPTQYDPSVVPVVWDIDAWHSGQRNIGYYDGHVKSSGAARTVTVSPMQAWGGPTGVHLRTGQTFRISAGGQWSADAPSVPLSLTTPSGKRAHAPPDMIRGDFPECGLIGRVGGTVFYVGYGGRFTAPECGELSLSINDNASLCDNNAGAVWAFIW